MTDDLIAMSLVEATIHAPAESIDLAEWVFTLTDDEYRMCSKDHIAGASSVRADGKRMSINVEHVGNLMVQHYVEEIADRSHCRLVSQTDSIGPAIGDRTKVIVVWEFFAEAIDAETTKFTNRTESHMAPGYLDALEKRGVSLEKARAWGSQVMNSHNAEETPLFAKDIERKARAGLWQA